MNTRHLLLPLALSLALAAPTAQALGLGQLQVKSGLNQPLVAEIPIISATPTEMDQLTVRLASPDAFARVGLDLPRELTANLQFSVGRNARGQPVVRISTTNKFTEPFLSFLIEADWGKGTVTREYTALIDPPYIAPAVIRPLETATVAAVPVQVPVAPPVQAPPPAPARTVAAAEPEPVSVAPTPEPVAEPPPPLPAPPPQPVVSRPAAPAPVRPAPRPVAPAPVPAPTPVPAPAPEKPGQYGPVEKGKTLWSIAESVKPDEALTTNQMMLALLRANPEAFDSDNINRLKSGSVLRIPGREEVATLGPAEAAALVQAQASAWRTPPAPVPQPAETIAERKPAETPRPATPAPTADHVAAAPAKPARRPAQSRLEIVPPSGKVAARGSQSGAAAGAGGSELRAELVQAKEDLAARTAEVAELKSRVADLDELNQKQQEMIQVQSSEMKALQDRLAELEQAKTATPAEPIAAAPAAKPDAKPAAANKPAATPAEEPASEPLYMNPYVLGGAGLLLLIGMVLALRRGRSASAEDAIPVRRISDDDALRASLAQTRISAAPEAPAAPPAAAPAAAAAKKAPEPKPVETTDRELENLKSAVKARPHDLEAHLSLLRYYHSHRQTAEYEAAAQIMRLQVPSTMDPRWREAVVMGAGLLPGHPLFSQAGWNAPQFGEPAAAPKAAAAEAPAKVAPAAAAVATAGTASAAATTVDAHADNNDWDRLVAQAGGASENLTDIDLSVPDFGVDTPKDVHRAEAEVLAEDEASATRIELAKAYLDIGDLDGARSMLEEVLIDGGPAAKAEALRILNELG
ncbi:FimV/HubP family polar landmark protein [Arenimonas sp.]|uniref:FimV/HubP family polar landmark protein n=1 Tax=Arenimonas sp. TaxID=1872635 RepID=UPI0039E69A7E